MGGLTYHISIGRQLTNTLILLAIAITSVIAISLLGAQRADAQAADRESILLTPSSSKLTIDAGETQAGKLTLINDGTVAYDVTVYARPYSINDNEYGNPDFTSPRANADLYRWVRLSKSTYRLEAKGRVDVSYTINVPDNAAPGGHYGVIFAEIQSTQKDPNSNSVVRKKRVGSIIYATINGQIDLKGDVDKGSIPFWQVSPPLHTEVVSSNSGNTHFPNTVELVVRDVFGNIKYRMAKEYLILPETTRTIDLDWNNSPWFGLFKVQTSQKFLDKTDVSEGYVLMMPRYMLVIFIAVLVGGGIYYALQRKKKK